MKTTKQKIKYDSGFTIVNFTGVNMRDQALCGQDLAGDGGNIYSEHGTYPQAEPTKDKVDCEDCLKIVSYCKSLKKKDF